jgi:hypothetical protein
MATRTSGWPWLAVLAVALLATAVPAQAAPPKSGNVIKCSDLASCFGAPAEDSDLSGPDASDVVSVGDDEGPDPSADNADPTSSQAATPQVPTPPTQGRSGAVGAEPPALAPYDACRNVDGIQPSVPLGQIRSDEGDCVYPPVNNAGMCLKDQFILTPVPQMAAGLAAKQQMALWVEGTGLVCWISDLVTYHSDPRFYVFAGYVGLGGPTDGPGGNGIYNSQSPYENWMLYPYWRKMTDAEHALAVTKRAKKRH